jgi:hypothetical protein
MIRGRRRLRLALAVGALLSLALPGCYDVPRPECGFRCGPDEACPEDYTCNPSDGRCHLDGAPPSLVCGPVDPPIDAATDAATDAP